MRKKIMTIIAGAAFLATSGFISAVDTTEISKNSTWMLLGAKAKFDGGWGLVTKYSTRDNVRTTALAPKAKYNLNTGATGNFLQEIFVGPTKYVKFDKKTSVGVAFLYRPIWQKGIRRDTIFWTNTFKYKLKYFSINFRFAPWFKLPHRLDGQLDDNGKLGRGDYQNLDFYTRYKLGFSVPIIGKSKSKNVVFGTAFEIFLNHTAKDEDKVTKTAAESTMQRMRFYADVTIKQAPVAYKLGYIWESLTKPGSADTEEAITQHYVVASANYTVNFTAKARVKDSALKKVIKKEEKK